MSIPSSPDWSALKNIGNYPSFSAEKPDPIVDISVYDISIGPTALSSSNGKLNERYWIVYAIGVDVFIAGALGGVWVGTVLLFSESVDIKSISITFDQTGRPIIFYRVGEDTLKTYQYNSDTGSDEIKVIAQGRNPSAGFDLISDASKANSDAMLFYSRGGGIYMRVQRERFEIEHETPAKLLKDLDIISTGMRVDNRYQVVYQYHDENYAPPPPQPPIPPEFTGDYVYMQGGATQFGLEKPLINSAQHDDISLAFNLYRMDGVLAGLNPTWGAYGIPIFCEGEQTTIYPIPLSYNTGFHFDINNTVAGYLREYKLLAASKFHLSFMYIEKVLYLVLVINGRKNTAVMPFVLSDGRWSVSIIGNVLTVKKGEAILFTTEVQRGTDASEKYPKPGRFGAYTLGPLYRMWRQNFGGALYAITTNIAGVETHYPLMTYNSQTQESIPPGNNISIYNYKPANWKYIAG